MEWQNNNLLLLKSAQNNVEYNLMFQLNVLLVCKLRIYFPIFGYAFVSLEIRFVQHMRYDSTSIIYQSRRNTRINVDLKMLRMCKLSSCHFWFWHVGINFDIYLGNKNVILSAAISLHNKTMSSAEYLWIIQNSRISFLLFVLQSKC